MESEEMVKMYKEKYGEEPPTHECISCRNLGKEVEQARAQARANAEQMKSMQGIIQGLRQAIESMAQGMSRGPF